VAVTRTTTSAKGADLDDDVVGRLRFSVTRLARLLRQQDESGLTPTMGAMLATIGRTEPVTLGALAAHEQVAPPTITKVIGKLEAAGLVERVPDAGDRRVCRVELTPAGHRQLATNRSRRTAWLAERLAALPAADRQRLVAAVAVLEQLTEAPAAEEVVR
jgi:DNA-binding MarR family transcriptional regulator